MCHRSNWYSRRTVLPVCSTSIDELIEIDEFSKKTFQLANLLRIGLATDDITVVEMSARALGCQPRLTEFLTSPR